MGRGGRRGGRGRGRGRKGEGENEPERVIVGEDGWVISWEVNVA